MLSTASHGGAGRPGTRSELGEYGSLEREYAALASRYDIRWSRYVDRAIRGTLSHVDVSPGDRLLDVGCGTGTLLQTVTRSVRDVETIGLDLSIEMLAVARTKLESAGLVQGQAEHLPFEDAAFDVVVSTNVFHFIRSPTKALDEMSRVLRPGGHMVITDWCRDYLACRIYEPFLRILKPAHYRTYGSRECRKLLEQEGFVTLGLERYRATWLWGLMTVEGTKTLEPSSARAA